MALNNIIDLLKMIQTLATMTKELERAHVEIKELRRDLHGLTIAVSKLDSIVSSEHLQTSLTIDNYGKDLERMKELSTAKFELLLLALDKKLLKFEKSTPLERRTKKRRALKTPRAAL